MKCKCSRHRAKVNFTFVDSKLAFKSLDCQRSKFTLRRGHGHTNKRPSQHIKTSIWKPLKIMKRNKRRNTFPSPPPPVFMVWNRIKRKKKPSKQIRSEKKTRGENAFTVETSCVTLPTCPLRGEMRNRKYEMITHSPSESDDSAQLLVIDRTESASELWPAVF